MNCSKEVYFIGLMDFSFDNTAPGKYLHWVRLTEEDAGYTFYNKLGFIFLELPNFNLTEKDVKTDLQRWVYVLRNMAKLDKIPITLHEKIFQKLFEIAEIANLNAEEYMLYQKDVLDKWTEYSVLKTAQEKGAEQKSLEVVKKMLAAGKFTISEIANFAGVTVSTVKRITQSLKGK